MRKRQREEIRFRREDKKIAIINELHPNLVICHVCGKDTTKLPSAKICKRYLCGDCKNKFNKLIEMRTMLRTAPRMPKSVMFHSWANNERRRNNKRTGSAIHQV